MDIFHPFHTYCYVAFPKNMLFRIPIYKNAYQEKPCTYHKNPRVEHKQNILHHKS